MNHEKLTTLAKKVFGEKFAKEYYLGMDKRKGTAYIKFAGDKIVEGSYEEVGFFLKNKIKERRLKIAKTIGMILFILGFTFIIGRVVYGLYKHGYIDGQVDARSSVVKEEYAEEIDNLMK
jgi:hypothetical protein